MYSYFSANIISAITPQNVGRDSSVGTATGYGPDGTGIEFRWVRDLLHPSRPVLGPTEHPIQWVSGLFPGGKVAWACCWPSTSSAADVKETVELYFYSPSGPSWHVLWWNLPLPLTQQNNRWNGNEPRTVDVNTFYNKNFSKDLIWSS
jgi:hypothetical protein